MYLEYFCYCFLESLSCNGDLGNIHLLATGLDYFLNFLHFPHGDLPKHPPNSLNHPHNKTQNSLNKSPNRIFIE